MTRIRDLLFSGPDPYKRVAPLFALDKITAAARSLGLDERALRAAAGVSVQELGEITDAHRVSLAFVRTVASAVQLTVADVLDHETRTESEARAQPTDVHMLDGILTEYGPLFTDEIADILCLTRSRTDSAISSLERELAYGPRRVVRDQSGIAITTARDVLSPSVRGSLRRLQYGRRRMDPRDAAALLDLLREAAHGVVVPRNQRDERDLVGQGLAVKEWQETTFGAVLRLKAHPDVLFALGLLDEPSDNTAADPPAWAPSASTSDC